MRKMTLILVSAISLISCGTTVVENKSCPVPQHTTPRVQPMECYYIVETLYERKTSCELLYDHMIDLMTDAVIEKNSTTAQRKMIKTRTADLVETSGIAGDFALTCFNEANKTQIECAMRSSSINTFAVCLKH